MHAAGQCKPQTLSTLHLRVPKLAVCKANIIAAPARSVPDVPALPTLPACRHFLNLTNGIEALPLLECFGIPYRWVGITYETMFQECEAANADKSSCLHSFVRIPSTWCEQQRFDLILANLDSSFLLQLALGHW